ncbi:hypothetical protein CYLTODRAFT_416675 [Cylindrobasidium torrendii FP15055 ss-10]|uniref:Zn(2)-C6 fungal-type domain-containing protein n=1 Tax=Cylindrobasidium torrendii FP15055 ss-10 TaxID=1314674 RepID=A0A0D7BTY7_9AGAR|nr:hypothetical protein CYLTODRAFT_416675 [Cylindrobasidium torrendii FP15055 ss-10]
MSEAARTTARPIQSCFQCRKRKIKCNRTYPCAPCVLRGEGGKCREVDKNIALSTKSTTETLEDVLHRVAALESIVTELSRKVANGQEGSTASSSSTASQVNSDDKPRIRYAYGATSTHEDVAMMLEDFAMGHRINQTRASIEYETSLDAGPSSSTIKSHRHPLVLLVDQATDPLERIVSMLPDERQSQALAQFYFDQLEWYSKILHAPMFMRDLATLYTKRDSGDAQTMRASFIGVAFMVFCLSFHLIDSNLCQELGIELQTAIDLSGAMYSAAQACIHWDDYMAVHTVENLQCILLMAVYQQNCDESDTHWALMGSAIKIAQNLGLSRLGSESDGRTFNDSWKSVVKREIARRVWWGLVITDWSHAASHNGTYAIHPSQNHTALPANINDSDLVDGQPLRARPPQEYTEMTFALARLRFVHLYREIVDEMNSPVGTGYNFVVEMDSRIEETLSEVPSFFVLNSTDTPRLSNVKSMEVTMCMIMGETRRLRLHRPFLFRGYRDKKYTNSRHQCIESAHNILNHLKLDTGRSAVLLKLWIVMFYGFAAAVVLFIDLCHMRAVADLEGEDDMEKQRGELRKALDLFKATEQTSIVSRNAIALLEGLLVAELELPIQTPSRKRTRYEDEDAPEPEGPFKRIVKRCLFEASQNTAPIASSSVYSSPPQTDIFADGAHSLWNLRDEGLFTGPAIDDTSMVDLAGLLYNDYGWGEGTF